MHPNTLAFMRGRIPGNEDPLGPVGVGPARAPVQQDLQVPSRAPAQTGGPQLLQGLLPGQEEQDALQQAQQALEAHQMPSTPTYKSGKGAAGRRGSGSSVYDYDYQIKKKEHQALQDDVSAAERAANRDEQDLFGIGATYLPTGDARQGIADLQAQEDIDRANLDRQVDAGLSGARQRAGILEGQLRDAGMLQLADQFRRSQRSIAFDTARRGTLGGSRSIERTQDAEAGRQAGAGQVALGAAQAGQSLYQQEASPFLAVQQQAQGSPLSNIGTNLAFQDLQSRGQGAGGAFNLEQQRTATNQALDQQEGQFYGGILSSVGQGVTAGARRGD